MQKEFLHNFSSVFEVLCNIHIYLSQMHSQRKSNCLKIFSVYFSKLLTQRNIFTSNHIVAKGADLEGSHAGLDCHSRKWPLNLWKASTILTSSWEAWRMRNLRLLKYSTVAAFWTRKYKLLDLNAVHTNMGILSHFYFSKQEYLGFSPPCLESEFQVRFSRFTWFSCFILWKIRGHIWMSC